MKRIASLDGLRAVSITLVFLCHLRETRHYPRNLATEVFSPYGHFGVEVFFVISGFLITSLLLREMENTGSIDLLGFYRRRAFRIFPAAFAYIGIVTLLAHPPAKYIAIASTYLMSYGVSKSTPWPFVHLWSLSVEEQFYFLWPFALALAFAARKQIAWAVMIIAPLVRLVCLHFGWNRIEFYFPTVADSIAAGCLLAIYYPLLKQKASRFTRLRFCIPLLIVTFATPALLEKIGTRPILLYGCIQLLIAACIFVAIERDDWILNNPVTSALGVLSYSLYLWQQPFLDYRRPAAWTAFPANIILALLCATVSYHLIEKRMLRFKSKPKQTPRTEIAEPAVEMLAATTQ